MDKCSEERKVWLEAQAEVEKLRKMLKAEDGRVFSSVNTPETLEKVAAVEADLEAAEERLKTTYIAYEDCLARTTSETKNN